MSWIRDHFYQFVFPAFMASGQISSALGDSFDVKVSPHAPEKLPAELKKLWTLCQEHGVAWSYDVRETGVSGGNSKFRESAKIHSKLLKDTLDAAQVEVKKEGCSRLLLGGRDVWTLAVLAERRGIPYLFVPELSRHVARSPLSRPFLEARGFTGAELFLDTGFAGSIPKSLKAHFGGDFKFRLMSQSDQTGKFKIETVTLVAEEDILVDQVGIPHRKMVKKGESYQVTTKEKLMGKQIRPQQIFAGRKNARAEALETEYLAKYWESANVENIKFQGHAPTVFKDWQNRPGVYRCSDPMGRNLGLTDGKEIIYVGLADIKHLVPEFAAWWQKLPECPYDKLPKNEVRVVQKFGTKENIQRAALLTSQMWRGIPYWKNIQPAPAGVKPSPTTKPGQVNQYTATYTNAPVTNNWAVTSNVATFPISINASVNTITTGTAGTAQIFVQDSNMTGMNMVAAVPPVPGIGQESILSAFIGMPMNHSTIVAMKKVVESKVQEALSQDNPILIEAAKKEIQHLKLLTGIDLIAEKAKDQGLQEQKQMMLKLAEKITEQVDQKLNLGDFIVEQAKKASQGEPFVGEDSDGVVTEHLEMSEDDFGIETVVHPVEKIHTVPDVETVNP